jgi:hypothetical protein
VGKEMTTEVIVMKYALTSGMFRMKATIKNGYASQVSPGKSMGYFLSHSDYVMTEDEAKIKFNEMRNKKIESLRKQTTKLYDKKFIIQDCIN